jgi:SAM-dependent methyltransferase
LTCNFTGKSGHAHPLWGKPGQETGKTKMLELPYRVLKVKLGKKNGWHREAIGGHWEEIGKLQFKFLVNQGLQSVHYLLDIGCGSLRGGVHFIEYLKTGRYFGIEKEKPLLEAGRRIELQRYDLAHKRPHLHLIDDFDLSPIQQDVQFDYMLAQSVFTHLKSDMIELCLARVLPRLKPNGTLYATFRESKSDRIHYGIPHLWRRNERMGVRYPFSLFQAIAERVAATVEYIGDWNHPRNQQMLAFRRS